MRFHVNSQGKPGQCAAAEGKCPFGADAIHYPTREAAQAGFEATMGASFDNPTASPIAPLEPQLAPSFHHLLTAPTDEQVVAAKAAYEAVSKEFVSSLPDAEAWAVGDYANQTYDEINAALWRGDTHPMTALLDSAIAKAAGPPRRLARKPHLGATREERVAALENFKPGETLNLAGYTSCSESLDALVPLLKATPRDSIFGRAEDETDENIIVTLVSPRAVPISSLSHMPQEREWLMPRDLSLKITSVEKVKYVSHHDPLGARWHRPETRSLTVVECEAP